MFCIKIDDVAQIEKIPAFSENRVSEKALLQFICLQGFNIYPVKILLTVMPARSSVPRETQTSMTAIYYIDTDEIPGFFLVLKNHIIFIAHSEHTIFIFHV